MNKPLQVHPKKSRGPKNDTWFLSVLFVCVALPTIAGYLEWKGVIDIFKGL